MQMEKEDLQEYLGVIVDLEKNKYLQEQLIKDLRQTVSSLGISKRLAPPFPPSLPPKSTFWDIALGIISGLFASILLWLVICVPVSLVNEFTHLIEITDEGLIKFLIGIFIVYLAIALPSAVFSKLSAKRKYSEKYEIYVEEYENYQNMVEQERLRQAQEISRKNYFTQKLEQVQEQYAYTSQCLAKAYALNIIYEKYRTMPQVCSLYEYICSGRCSTLEEVKGCGSGGAYNILEQELLQKTIILRLDQIIQHLGTIQANQYMLYAAINESNQRLSNIESSINQISEKIDYAPFDQKNIHQKLDELERNSALAAYTAERIERELSYMNRMNYFAGKYDDAGMFRKRPPV